MKCIQSIESGLSRKRISLLRVLFMLSFVISIGDALPAMAVAVTWSLNDVKFSDGGIATGSIVADASNQLLLDFNLSVSGGDELTFPSFTYTPTTAPGNPPRSYSGPLSGWGSIIDGFAQGGTPESRLLALIFARPLTDAGGTVPLDLTNSVECFNCSPFRLIVSGSVEAPTVVPVPSALLLFTSGLASILGYGWRQKRARAKDGIA